MKHDVITEPNREKASTNLAILPVSDQNAASIFSSTIPYLDGYFPTNKPLGDFYSSTYHTAVPEYFIRDILFGGDPSQGSTDNLGTLAGLGENTLARTTANFMLGHDRHGKDYVMQTRPLQILKHSTLAESDGIVGAIAVHEGVHTQDLINDGSMFLTMPYGACTELRAYQATSIVVGSIYGESESNWHDVENARKNALQDVRRPFMPSSQLIEWMINNGSV